MSDASNAAYRERNQLVAALTRLIPDSYYSLDESEPPPWQHVVYVEGPAGQMSWHVGDDDFDDLFPHLLYRSPRWDGHTTEEKYERLRRVGGS